ncbi:MAG TPA: tripartite tricarboxylate transporter substrate binding protein [Burkholderiales bacterium]|nr:tripartite tricarboxylate transporter substrate binding protein [Burkholderiales bacterium]
MQLTQGCVAVALLAAAAVAHAQANYPVKPIRIIVPFSPGGSLDLVSRALAKPMSAELGHPVIVDNRAGAGGTIGIEAAARAPADGYTLLAIQSSITINPSLLKSVPYDPIKDFDPISKVSSYMFFLVAHPSAPVRSVKQLIALAKSRPGELQYASVGVGSGTHLAGELFNWMSGIKMTHIAYKGAGPLIIELVGGHVMLTFGSTSVLPHVVDKKLVLLGVTGAQRSTFVPDAPTIAESGLKGYEVTSWNALFAPAGTPPAIVSRLNGLVKQGLAHPESKAVFARQGLDATPSTQAELGALVKSELVKWAKVIKQAGIQPN